MTLEEKIKAAGVLVAKKEKSIQDAFFWDLANEIGFEEAKKSANSAIENAVVETAMALYDAANPTAPYGSAEAMGLDDSTSGVIREILKEHVIS